MLCYVMSRLPPLSVLEFLNKVVLRSQRKKPGEMPDFWEPTNKNLYKNTVRRAPIAQTVEQSSCGAPHTVPLLLHSTCAETRCPYQRRLPATRCPVRCHLRRAGYLGLSCARAWTRARCRQPTSRPGSCGASGAACPIAHSQSAVANAASSPYTGACSTRLITSHWSATRWRPRSCR